MLKVFRYSNTKNINFNRLHIVGGFIIFKSEGMFKMKIKTLDIKVDLDGQFRFRFFAPPKQKT